MVPVEHRLGVECIDLRRPAVHEQVNDMPGFRGEVRLLRREWVGDQPRHGGFRNLSAGVVSQYASERDHPEPGAAAGQHLAAGEW